MADMQKVILVDTREPVDYAYHFSRWPEVTTWRTTLKYGDYSYGWNVWERKGCNNFRNILCPSKFDKELAKIARAVEAVGYDHYMLGVEGNPEDFIFEGAGYSANWHIRPPVSVIRNNIRKLSEVCMITWGRNRQKAEEDAFNFLVFNIIPHDAAAWDQIMLFGNRDAEEAMLEAKMREVV